MYNGDLLLPYFLCKFSKNTCIFHFYVLQYNYIKGRIYIKMEKIVNWLMSCGYNKENAYIEANKMIERNRWYGCGSVPCSREFAIEMILADIEE